MYPYYRAHQPVGVAGDNRFFFWPFLAGLAGGAVAAPLVTGGFGGGPPAPHGPPMYGGPIMYGGPSYGPQYGPQYGPSFGPQYGPDFGPVYGPYPGGFPTQGFSD